MPRCMLLAAGKDANIPFNDCDILSSLDSCSSMSFAGYLEYSTLTSWTCA